MVLIIRIQSYNQKGQTISIDTPFLKGIQVAEFTLSC
jgi:hypothetical protein